VGGISVPPPRRIALNVTRQDGIPSVTDREVHSTYEYASTVLRVFVRALQNYRHATITQGQGAPHSPTPARSKRDMDLFSRGRLPHVITLSAMRRPGLHHVAGYFLLVSTCPKELVIIVSPVGGDQSSFSSPLSGLEDDR
jgi:hypothetical protein